MGFVKTDEELKYLSGLQAHFSDAENVALFWETTPDVVKRLLPPPLEPADFPLVYAFIANYPKINATTPYKEAGLALACKYNGEVGFHCIAMPVTTDMAMALGREVYGYPKKMAQISFNYGNGVVEGWAERHGVRFFQAKARLTGKPNASDAPAIISKYAQPPTKMFQFKHFRAPDRSEEGFKYDYNPRLIRQEISRTTKKMEIGEVEIILDPSENDPWAEVKVVRPLIAMHSVYDSTMEHAKVVAEVDPEKFHKYSYFNFDLKVPSSTKIVEPIKPQIKH